MVNEKGGLHMPTSAPQVLARVLACSHTDEDECQWFSVAVQAAYEDADSAATSLQAVAPVGLKHLQSDKLVMKEKAVPLHTVMAED